MEDKKILTVCPPEYPGTTSVLKHYNPTGLVEHSDTVSPDTVEEKSMVIFGGWHPIYYEAAQRVKSANVEVGLFWTSSVGQTDFSNNGMEISYLHVIMDWCRSDIIDKVFGATPSVVDMLQQFIEPEKVVLLPYAFDWESVQDCKKDITKGDDWIDLFCPGDTRKNILVQTHGAKIADAHLHYSGLRTRYRWFADMIGVKYTDMGWMQKDKYYDAVQSMRLGMQVTYAETFDYVVAEHFALGVPCLISTVMGSWVTEDLWDELLVQNIDDPFEVADCITTILNMDEDRYDELSKDCWEFMKEEAERRNAKVEEILNKVIK